MRNRDYTNEEEKILKMGLGTVLWKIIFWPCFVLWLFMSLASISIGSNGVSVFIIISIPMSVITYFAFRKQWFWSESKQREYIETVKGRRQKYRKFVANNAILSNDNHSSEDTPVAFKVLYQGDYAKTIFLWVYKNPCAVMKREEYPRYFRYECGIGDCSAYHRNLINEGYFREATFEEKLDSLKVSELKEILVRYSLSLSGKKNELVKRIVESVPLDKLSYLQELQMYSLTPMGYDFIDEHEAYVEVHKHRDLGITWQEYDANASQGEPFTSVAWRIMVERQKSATLAEHRNNYLHMAMLQNEKGNRSDALELLLKVLYLDMSGSLQVMPFTNINVDSIQKWKMINQVDACITLAPGVFKMIGEYGDVYDSFMIDELYSWRLPLNACPQELFMEIVEKCMKGEFVLEEYSDRLKKLYIEMIEAL